MGGLKVVTTNVNGLNNPIKRKNILQILKQQGEIIYIQETHLSKEEHEKIGKLAGVDIFSASYSTSKRGVAVLINKKIGFVKEKCIRDKDGRFIFVCGEIDAQPITLINIYNPPGEGATLIKRILHLLMTEAKGLTIMGGDFNLIMNQKIDTESRIKHKSEITAKLLREAKLELGLLDVWQSLHPKDKAFTFYSGAHKVSSRLDYFFMFKDDLSKVNSCEIVPFPLSDHSSVVIELNLHRERKETLWRFNNSLLMEEMFNEKIIAEFKIFLNINDNSNISPILLWETAKATLRGTIIAYSSWRKK